MFWFRFHYTQHQQQQSSQQHTVTGNERAPSPSLTGECEQSAYAVHFVHFVSRIDDERQQHRLVQQLIDVTSSMFADVVVEDVVTLRMRRDDVTQRATAQRGIDGIRAFNVMHRLRFFVCACALDLCVLCVCWGHTTQININNMKRAARSLNTFRRFKCIAHTECARLLSMLPAVDGLHPANPQTNTNEHAYKTTLLSVINFLQTLAHARACLLSEHEMTHRF